MKTPNMVTGNFEVKGVSYSEFELGHAFAFRSFDSSKIFQRRFFGEFGFGADMTDEEILQAFDYERIFNIGDSDLERNAEKLSDLLFSIDSYEKKIYHHWQRLEKYTNKTASVIANGNVADIEAVRLRYKRGVKLMNSYACTYGFIKSLKRDTEKTFKKFDGEVKHFYRKIFADRLKFARQETGLNQKTFAKKLGLTQNGYSPYENAQRDASIPILIRLSKLLDRSIDWLLGQVAW